MHSGSEWSISRILPEILLFLAASAPVVWYSLPSLRNRRTHGFYRFFAFEGIVALILVNVRFWFDDPFSLRQICSWILLVASAALAIHAFRLFHVAGKPEGNFENTTLLVRRGAYRFIRHPMYASLMYLALGAMLKNLSLSSVAFTLIAAVALLLTARTEERENRTKFGVDYERYMRETKMFIPYVL